MTSAEELGATVAKAVVVFASTNVDDIVLLTVLFADPQLRPRTVAAGQFLGIGVLVAASAVASAVAVAIFPGWVSLIGVVPLALGLYKGIEVVRSRGKTDDAEQDGATSSKLARGSQVIAVAGVTLANGGDNVGVYVPLFAVERRVLLVYVVVFTAMTALWCALAYKLVNNRFVGDRIRRYGHVVLPIVLVLLGIHILAGVRAVL